MPEVIEAEVVPPITARESSFYNAQAAKFRGYATAAGIENNATNLKTWDLEHNLGRIRDYYEEKHGSESIYELGLTQLYHRVWYNSIPMRVGTARDGKPVTMLQIYGPTGSKASVFAPVNSRSRQTQIQQQLGIIERATVRLRVLELPLDELRQRIEEFYIHGEE